VIKRLKGRFSKGKGRDKTVQVTSRKRVSVAKRLERYAEAAALAQAGAQDLAQEIIRREIQERPKILVIGHEDGFSRPLVDYAVAFAKRMAYEIVALNCAVMGRGAPADGLNSGQSELFQEFQRKAAKGVEFLARRAVEEGVPLQHVVKAGPPDRCLRELEEEVSRLMFVLTETEATLQVGMDRSIPVFCLEK